MPETLPVPTWSEWKCSRWVSSRRCGSRGLTSVLSTFFSTLNTAGRGRESLDRPACMRCPACMICLACREVLSAGPCQEHCSEHKPGRGRQLRPYQHMSQVAGGSSQHAGVLVMHAQRHGSRSGSTSCFVAAAGHPPCSSFGTVHFASASPLAQRPFVTWLSTEPYTVPSSL